MHTRNVSRRRRLIECMITRVTVFEVVQLYTVRPYNFVQSRTREEMGTISYYLPQSCFQAKDKVKFSLNSVSCAVLLYQIANDGMMTLI